MNKKPINQAIAEIIGENPEAEPRRDDDGNVIVGICDAIYPAYSADANAALRALAWLKEQLDMDVYIDSRGAIFAVGVYQMHNLYSTYNPSPSMPGAICHAVVQFSRANNPDLMDYNNIDWGDNE